MTLLMDYICMILFSNGFRRQAGGTFTKYGLVRPVLAMWLM